MKKRLTAFSLRRFVGDFNTVRRGADREVSHVVVIGHHAHFQMSCDMRDFGNAYGRLPRWARALAVALADGSTTKGN